MEMCTSMCTFQLPISGGISPFCRLSNMAPSLDIPKGSASEAAASGSADTLEKLLSKPGAAHETVTSFGFTPMHIACGATRTSRKGNIQITDGHLKCVRLLLDAGGDPCAAGPCGWTPAHYAALSGSLPLMEMLYAALPEDGRFPLNDGCRSPYDIGERIAATESTTPRAMTSCGPRRAAIATFLGVCARLHSRCRLLQTRAWIARL